MAKTPENPVKPTTMRIPQAVLARGAKQAKRHDRSRSWLFLKYIEDGLARDEQPSTDVLG